MRSQIQDYIHVGEAPIASLTQYSARVFLYQSFSTRFTANNPQSKNKRQSRPFPPGFSHIQHIWIITVVSQPQGFVPNSQKCLGSIWLAQRWSNFSSSIAYLEFILVFHQKPQKRNRSMAFSTDKNLMSRKLFYRFFRQQKHAHDRTS